MRRVCSTLIECLQNVSRHGWVDDEGEIQLYLTLEHTPLGLQIRIGNLVDFDMAAGLRENLAKSMACPRELRSVRRTAVQQRLVRQRGAGLGLISMAKKSNGPLDYEFNELESGMFLFTLAVMVKS